MLKKTILVARKNVALLSNDGLFRPSFIVITQSGAKRNASSGGSNEVTQHDAPEPLRSGLLASYGRGTGGRQSFSGNVCTVFGASGMLGTHVINRLGKEGTQIIIPYRADSYWVRHLKPAGDLGQILFFPFDLKDEDSIRKVVRYSNVVINMIGRDYETYNYSYDEVNAIGAGRIARIAREMNVKRHIYFSAMNASFEPEEHLIPGGSRFLKSKALGEKMVRDEFPETIIVRPSDAFGFDDRFTWCYCNSWRRNVMQQLSLYRSGDYTYKGPVHMYNISQGVMSLLHDPTTDGKTFEFVGPHWYKLGDLIDWLYRIIHRYESRTYNRHNIDPWHSFKTNVYELKQMITKRQYHWDWEKIERTEAISDVLTGCPTLADLGVELYTIEDKVPPFLKLFDKLGPYKPRLGEYPEPPWPKRLPPLKKQAPASINSLYETVVGPSSDAQFNV